jgi:carbon-monoxide dehydrogenase medium subunit
MFPAEFDYFRATTVDEALALLEANPEAELLAGGHSLLPTMKLGLASPSAVVDISGIDALHGVDVGDDVARVGALTRYATIADDAAFRRVCPAVGSAAAAIGDVQVRNRGTIGGNLAHADPASDLPAAVLASDATLTLVGPDGERTVPADEFFVAIFTTAKEEGELLTRVDLPVLGEESVGVYAKKPSPSSGYAVVGVAAVLELDDGVVSTARVAANGAFDHAVRLTGVEDALVDESLDEERVERAAAAATDGFDESALMSDHHVSADYRAELLRAYTERALTEATERADAPVAAD